MVNPCGSGRLGPQRASSATGLACMTAFSASMAQLGSWPIEDCRAGATMAPHATLYCQKTRPTWRIGASRGLPIVIVQHPAEFLLASDTACFGQRLGRFDEFVLDPLVIASMAIMTDENRDFLSTTTSFPMPGSV